MDRMSEQNKGIYHNETQSSGLSLNAGIRGTAAGQIGLNGKKQAERSTATMKALQNRLASTPDRKDMTLQSKEIQTSKFLSCGGGLTEKKVLYNTEKKEKRRSEWAFVFSGVSGSVRG